jgi:chemotaxis protein MotB
MLTKKARPAPRKPPPLPGFPQSHGSSWKVAYADFVTAMMAFFLLMWIMNMVPPSTQKQLEQYFKEGPKPLMAALPPAEKNALPPGVSLGRDDATRYAIAVRFKKIITEDPFFKQSSGVSSDDVGVLLRIQNGMLFQAGSAELTGEAKRILAEVVDVLKTYNLYLVIRGHADPAEADKSGFASNWELSGARAAAAARYLIAEGGLQPSRIRAVAYGDSRPLVPEFTPEAAAANRRVEFYFHRPEATGSPTLY